MALLSDVERLFDEELQKQADHIRQQLAMVSQIHQSHSHFLRCQIKRTVVKHTPGYSCILNWNEAEGIIYLSIFFISGNYFFCLIYIVLNLN